MLIENISAEMFLSVELLIIFSVSIIIIRIEDACQPYRYPEPWSFEMKILSSHLDFTAYTAYTHLPQY